MKHPHYKNIHRDAAHLDELRERFTALEDHIRLVQAELEELQTLTSKLLDVGVAISSEIDLYALLTRIIDEAKGLLRAQRGTLYLVDQKTNELYFHVTDAAKIKEIRIPINENSISGYVALTGKELNIPDVYKIGKDKPYTFNKKIDRKSGYRSRSMLTVPMLNHEGIITGVVQLINKTVQDSVAPFSERDQRILMSLASQAAVAIENAQLYKEIADLFEAFVRYSASAIDERDPATAGHSRRVAMYTTAVARAMDCFTEAQMKEINYAAWLHDVGKIGVREQILVKQNKLYPHQFEKVEERFNAAKLSTRAEYLEKKTALIAKDAPPEKLEALAAEMEAAVAAIEEDLTFIAKINVPGFMTPENLKKVDSIAAKKFRDAHGGKRNLLNSEEKAALKVVRGNLNNEERRIMNAHATSTHRILSQIPFTRALHNVPEIASTHHEKLDGSGYPWHLKDRQISLQAKIIALVDIYDAITAQDRPYKPAIPVERALKILESEVSEKRLDAHVFQIFVDNKIFELPDPGDTLPANSSANNGAAGSKRKKAGSLGGKKVK